MSIATGHAELTRASLLPDAPTQGVFWDRLPVVADASTLIGDCLRLARCEHDPGRRAPLLLHLSRDLPFVSLFATESVRGEVEEHLAAAAAAVHIPIECAERAWRDHYAPVISFVELAPLPTCDPRLVRLSDADLDDLPTGSLAELLGPCLVFSADRHLLSTGIARRDWGNLMTHALDVGRFQAGQSGTIMVVFLIGALAVEGGSAVAGLARRAPVPALALGGLAGLLLYGYSASDRGGRHRGDIHSVAVQAWDRLGPFLVRVSECEQLLEQAAFIPEGDPSELALVARVVATSPHPRRPSEIAARTSLSTQKATSILASPIFTRTNDGAYILGSGLVAE